MIDHHHNIAVIGLKITDHRQIDMDQGRTDPLPCLLKNMANIAQGHLFNEMMGTLRKENQIQRIDGRRRGNGENFFFFSEHYCLYIVECCEMSAIHR
jgi:hypothetical protein